MRVFEVLFIIGVFAITRGSSFCTYHWPNFYDETPYEPRYKMKVQNIAGDSVGELEYCNHGNYAAFVHGSLKGLPAGQYIGVAHDYANFNGSCSTAGKILKEQSHNLPRMGVSPFTIASPDFEVRRAYTQDLYFGCDEKRYPYGQLVLIYPLLTNDRKLLEEMAENKVNSPPVACGVIKLQGECKE